MSPVARTLAVAGGILGVTLLARRAGYHLGTRTPVRCRQGHLFTTVWIPGVSVKSLRLGWWRLQFCPVGRHWSLVSPVRQSALTAESAASSRSIAMCGSPDGDPEIDPDGEVDT